MWLEKLTGYKSFLAMDIQDDFLNMAEFSLKKHYAELTKTFSGIVDEMDNSLERIIRLNGFSVKNVSVCVGGNGIEATFPVYPVMDAEELKNSLYWDSQMKMPGRYCDFVEVERDEESIKMFCVSIERSKLDRITDELQANNIFPNVIEYRPLMIYRALNAYGIINDKQSVIYIEKNGNKAELTLILAGYVMKTTSIIVEPKKLVGKVVDEMAKLESELFINKIIVGEIEKNDNFVAQLKKKSRLPVEALKLVNNFVISPTLDIEGLNECSARLLAISGLLDRSCSYAAN